MPGLQRYDLHWKWWKTEQGIKYEVRCYVAILGSGPREPWRDIFDEPHDTYLRGVGYSMCAALRVIKREFKELHESLWA